MRGRAMLAAVVVAVQIAGDAAVPLALDAKFNGAETHTKAGLLSPFLSGDILDEALEKLRQLDGGAKSDHPQTPQAAGERILDADPRVIPYPSAKRSVFFDEFSKEALNETLAELWTISPTLKAAYDKAKTDLEGQFLYIEKMIGWLRQTRLRVERECPQGSGASVSPPAAEAGSDVGAGDGSDASGADGGAEGGAEQTGSAGGGLRFKGSARSYAEAHAEATAKADAQALQERVQDSKQQLHLCQMSLSICLTDQKTVERERDMYRKVYEQSDEYKRLRQDSAASGNTIVQALSVIEDSDALERMKAEAQVEAMAGRAGGN